MARSHNNDRDEFYFKQGSCNIILKQGDLLDENDVDVVIIPTPDLNELNPDNFVLFKSIHSKADDNYKREIKRVRSDLKLLHPQAISKNGRGRIFAVPPYLGNHDKACDLLKKTYTSCLDLAVKNNFRKIAFPTIGCGVIGFETIDAARVIYSAFENFGQTKDGKKIDEIRIIVYDSDVWTDFTTTFIDLSDYRDAKIKFIEISSKKSNPTEMPLKRDKERTTQRQSQEEETNHYSDDFDDTADPAKKKTSSLNPESPEYRPKPNNQRRDYRRYLLSNKRTELHIFQGDILETKVDAIVNAANESMLGGSGVDGIIHRAAGDELLRACKAHKQIYRDVRLPTGRSRILLSYNMSKTTYYIINTAGPRYDDAPPQKCKEDLISCYKTSLALANLYDLETIGFTAISCGIFGYPIDEAAQVALTTVDNNAESMRKILFVLKDDDIYDAWVKNAEKLGFIALDDNSARATNASKQPTGDTRKTTENSSPKDESNVPKQPSEMEIMDTSKSDSTRKPVRSNRDKSPENFSPNPNEKSNNQEPVGNEEDTRVPDDDDDGTKKKKSEKKTNNNRETEKASNNSSQQKQARNKDQSPEPQSVQQDTKKSIVSGVLGRGRKR